MKRREAPWIQRTDIIAMKTVGLRGHENLLQIPTESEENSPPKDNKA
jgi:hypothetical protein